MNMLPRVMHTLHTNIHWDVVRYHPYSLELHCMVCCTLQTLCHELGPFLFAFLVFVMDLNWGQAETEPNAVYVQPNQYALCVSH